MHGTRDAPAEWQRVVKKTSVSLDFRPSQVVPCLYYKEARKLRVVVHVDDFMCTGSGEDLGWLERELEKQFELTTETLGGEEADSQEVVFL